MVEVTATFPAGKVGTTAENLKAAAEGENEEWADLYPQFAEVAAAEGFQKVANVFKNIAKVEKEHEARYLALMANVLEGKVYEREEKVRWRCRNCGFVHESTKAPKVCPACDHDKEHFEIEVKNY
ncbi:rubrerythrin [Geofilum rubicundum JCM 15548]|uniref:Rubrerythrin n=2 Tax=Geofilum TaxID=1236988 RepID=A0A0E9LYH3_9BACT|nr:rubrerythrin [Geofilum rubicundum JCM 15548]